MTAADSAHRRETRAYGECEGTAPPKGRESGPDHEPVLTGGAHSQSGPLGPKTQEPVTGRRKSLSYIQPAHRTPLSGTLLTSAGHVYFLHGIPTRPSAWGHMNFD